MIESKEHHLKVKQMVKFLESKPNRTKIEDSMLVKSKEMLAKKNKEIEEILPQLNAHLESLKTMIDRNAGKIGVSQIEEFYNKNLKFRDEIADLIKEH